MAPEPIILECPDCGAGIEVTVSMRFIHCNCTDADRHAHVVLHHNAEDALALHRGTHE